MNPTHYIDLNTVSSDFPSNSLKRSNGRLIRKFINREEDVPAAPLLFCQIKDNGNDKDDDNDKDNKTERRTYLLFGPWIFSTPHSFVTSLTLTS